jgi:uncharacterized protein
VPLLRHVSGLNQLTARTLVEYRQQNGVFKSRDQFKQVPGIGEATFTQAAGFLKIAGGDNPLDQTWIHPESYPATQKLLAQLGYGPEALTEAPKTEELREKLRGLTPEEICKQLEIGVPTFCDIVESLSRPGRDPREDLPKPIFKKGILKLEDLQPGMELKGTVLNVVDFGAFVDVGLKDSGLVHISQLANRYIRSPYDVVAVGDVVTVWVIGVDQERRRVSLTMIQPGTERKPQEKKPRPQPQQRRQPQQAQGQGQGQGGGRPRHGRPPAARPGVQIAYGSHTAQGAAAQAARVAQQGDAAQVAQPQEAGVAAAAAHGQGQHGRQPQPQRPQPPPRRERPKPKPKLSQEALQGAAPLRSFAELAAFMEATKKQE